MTAVMSLFKSFLALVCHAYAFSGTLLITFFHSTFTNVFYILVAFFTFFIVIFNSFFNFFYIYGMMHTTPWILGMYILAYTSIVFVYGVCCIGLNRLQIKVHSHNRSRNLVMYCVGRIGVEKFWKFYLYTLNHKKTWHFIFDYNFGQS